jgi:hypothetical protein
MQFYFTINNSKHVFSSYILKVINKDSLEEAKKEKNTDHDITKWYNYYKRKFEVTPKWLALPKHAGTPEDRLYIIIGDSRNIAARRDISLFTRKAKQEVAEILEC